MKKVKLLFLLLMSFIFIGLFVVYITNKGKIPEECKNTLDSNILYQCIFPEDHNRKIQEEYDIVYNQLDKHSDELFYTITTEVVKRCRVAKGYNQTCTTRNYSKIEDMINRCAKNGNLGCQNRAL